MTTKALTISIVIPAYNEEHHLKACLESIAAQTEQPDEVIVVDNNSTDKTAEIARQFPFVRLLHEKKKGVTYARNTGFNAVSSELIGRLDADTHLPPDWVAKMKTLFHEQPDLTAISGPSGFYDLPHPKATLVGTKIIRTFLFYIGRSSNKYLFGSNMAVRSAAWQKVAKHVCHERGLHEDNDLAIHLSEAGYHVHYSNKIVVYISVRRADATPRQAVYYAFSEYRTYRHHDIISIHAWLAGVVLLTVYPMLKWLRRGYDDTTGHYSWRKWRTYQSKPRPHPMD